MKPAHLERHFKTKHAIMLALQSELQSLKDLTPANEEEYALELPKSVIRKTAAETTQNQLQGHYLAAHLLEFRRSTNNGNWVRTVTRTAVRL
ncbi:hypothetical protein EYF80_014171 [Liparis tanakae]|uniref:Uncharacterized protein n=1 Tax=Liparis tanakae TaxID=230148 RepID=A0A4Z2ID22_9TELE|nr:hypothetical protein EYF80_014171 [Liparis tanakae]